MRHLYDTDSQTNVSARTFLLFCIRREIWGTISELFWILQWLYFCSNISGLLEWNGF